MTTERGRRERRLRDGRLHSAAAPQNPLIVPPDYGDGYLHRRDGQFGLSASSLQTVYAMTDEEARAMPGSQKKEFLTKAGRPGKIHNPIVINDGFRRELMKYVYFRAVKDTQHLHVHSPAHSSKQ